MRSGFQLTPKRPQLACILVRDHGPSRRPGLLFRKTSHVPMPVRAVAEVAHQWKSWLPRVDDVLEIGAEVIAR